ncbi:MAG: AAA family ATPase [Flavobacteriales bacterium]|nr:AAA family ATPase [Flavobacteriales bacterium]MBK6944165.1 AAA family ATPase [Flavobacteriales bacterium]MBK7240366.1 AAA family ATPase [Flavobacteriales bacterium]MBK9533832.1 AAA family ATPase [Flavobacteriales bacterium]MBP9137117.1 AAA family ATPase [Flavobacteriales bacterium]
MAKAVKPKCIVIAGPNGAGKTTFAKTFLSKDANVLSFLNVDLIAAGLSPLRPELSARAAGRIVLKEIERCIKQRRSFAIESTLSGMTYTSIFKNLLTKGYALEILFLKIDDPKICIRRVAERVKQGGHHIPEHEILRRHARGWKNFNSMYRELATNTWVFDASGPIPVLLEQ